MDKELKRILYKYPPDLESCSPEQLDELAQLGMGLSGALRAAQILGLGSGETYQVVLAGILAAFEMGKHSGALRLQVESEPFGTYEEREVDGEEVYDRGLLTPSQADVRNHINEVAGLSRRWVPA